MHSDHKQETVLCTAKSCKEKALWKVNDEFVIAGTHILQNGRWKQLTRDAHAEAIYEEKNIQGIASLNIWSQILSLPSLPCCHIIQEGKTCETNENKQTNQSWGFPHK